MPCPIRLERPGDVAGIHAVHAEAFETDAEARLDKAQGHNPFGRLTCVDEIAHSARFLLSPAARGINGQVIVVDGGSRIRSV